jgi:PHD/YefM family antitoxin component YafN of YafNO toxin-antitoxin module
MDVVSTSVLRNNLADTLKEVSQKRDYLLVSKKGKLISALVNLDFFEDLLALTSKKYLNSLKEAREDYKAGRYYSLDEAFGELE